MTAKTVLITGSSRGIGLKFVEEYIKLGWNVIAAVRNPAKAEKLVALTPYKIVQLDSADESSILSASKELDGESIDLLINNAGISVPGDLASFTKADVIKQFEVNSVGPFLVTRAFVPHLKAAVTKNGSANVAQISSRVGSITLNAGSMYGYRTSKTALNMINSCLAIDLKSDNIGSFVVHPGYVATDMTGGVDLVMGDIVVKAISADTSVSDLIKVFGNFTIANTGKFYNHTGDELPCLFVNVAALCPLPGKKIYVISGARLLRAIKNTDTTTMKLPLRRIIILLFNIASTWLTLFTGLRENPVIVYITGKYDYMRSRMIDGGVNYNSIRPALIEPGVLVDLAEAGKNYRFFSAPTRTTKNLLEDRSICMRLDSINGSVLDVYFDDFWGKGPRRTGVTVYSISAPSCKVINLKPKWVTDCIQNHGNASQCHHHILNNFEDLQQDRSIQSASTSDFGVKGAPFLKCLERPEQDFPYLTDALLFHNYWAGGSRHLEFTTSNCMAKFLVREKNWKWGLFQTSSIDDRGAMVFAIENSGWFTILVNFLYGFVSIGLIVHGIFALAAQEKRVFYVPRIQRFVNDTKYFKFLFPSMMVPITFPDDDTTVVQFKGSVIMGSDVWMNHWLYITMSILDAVVNIRSTYVIFQTGTFLVGRKANLENFLFLASSLTKTTWLMCFVHTVIRWVLKIIARALKNIRMVHPSVREKLDWYADASSMFLSYKIYSIMLFTLLCILLSYKKSTFQIRQVPGKRGVFGGDPALATFWGSELMCDMFVLLSLMTLGGYFIGTVLLFTNYRHVANNRVMKLLQKRYFFVGWDALIAMEALGIDPMASDAVVEGVAVANCSVGALLRQLYISGPSGLVSLSGDYLFEHNGFSREPVLFRFPIKRAIIMGLCPTARNSSRSHLTSTRVYAPRVVAQSHRTSAVDESTKLDEIDEKNTIQSCLLENRKGSKSIFERQLILFSISTYGRLLLVDESEPGKLVKNAETNLTEYVVRDALSFASILDIKPLLANQKKLKIA